MYVCIRLKRSYVVHVSFLLERTVILLISSIHSLTFVLCSVAFSLALSCEPYLLIIWKLHRVYAYLCVFFYVIRH